MYILHYTVLKGKEFFFLQSIKSRMWENLQDKPPNSLTNVLRRENMFKLLES